MMKFKGFKFAMAAVLVSFAAMFTSCGSDDNDSTTGGNTGSGTGTTTTKTLKSVRVTYHATPLDTASIKAITASNGVYMRYVDSNGSIKQSLLDFDNLNQSVTVDYTVGDSVYFGMEMVAVAKDTTELKNLSGSYKFHITLKADVVSTFSDGSTSTDSIVRSTTGISGLTLPSDMYIEYGGAPDMTYTLTTSTRVSTFIRHITNWTSQYGGMVFNCFSAKAVPYLENSNYSALGSTYWMNNKFTAQ